MMKRKECQRTKRGRILLKIKSLTLMDYRSYDNGEVTLRNYNLVTGPNSSGKSNLFHALLCFFNYPGFKYEKEKDLRKSSGNDHSKITVKYEFDKDDTGIKEILSLSQSYNQISISCELDSMNYKLEERPETKKSTIIKFLEMTKVIFIPAIPNSEEAFKLTGSTLMRNAMKDIILEIWENSQSAVKINEVLHNALDQLMNERTVGGVSMKQVTDDINKEMKKLNLQLNFDPLLVDSSKILSNFFTLNPIDTLLNNSVDQETISTGQLKFLFYNLIRVIKDIDINKKAEPNYHYLKLLIFEEPEAFLHPSNQLTLANSMRNRSRSEGWQFIISTHSPHFVSKEIENMQDIIRIERNKSGISHIFKISEEQFGALKENADYIAYLKKILIDLEPQIKGELKVEIDNKLSKHDKGLDEFMFHLYLNSERSRLFLSNKVIVCEGITDKILIENIIENMGEEYLGEIYVLETNGKYNMVRYLKILNFFGIKHLIVYDTDRDKPKDKTLAVNLNEFIDKFTEDNHTFLCGKLTFDPNLEAENGFNIPGYAKLTKDEKALYVIKKIHENDIPNYEKIKEKIENKVKSLFVA